MDLGGRRISIKKYFNAKFFVKSMVCLQLNPFSLLIEQALQAEELERKKSLKLYNYYYFQGRYNKLAKLKLFMQIFKQF